MKTQKVILILVVTVMVSFTAGFAVDSENVKSLNLQLQGQFNEIFKPFPYDLVGGRGETCTLNLRFVVNEEKDVTNIEFRGETNNSLVMLRKD